MTIPSHYPFPRYLAAKKTVDDRALNQHVQESLKSALSLRSRGRETLRVLEIGAGIGTMIERAIDRGLITHAEYTAIDSMAENIAEAENRLPRWAEENGYRMVAEPQGRLRLTGPKQDVAIVLETADLFDFMAPASARPRWDLVIANAFLDLVDVPATLPDILDLLEPGGLFYFTITFDGSTILEPPVDAELDALIETLYHQDMDKRIIRGRPSGDSRTGRHFFEHVRAEGAELIDAGASDWVVFAGPDGYPAEEGFFLHFIVHTMGEALKGHAALDAEQFAGWVETRHRQIEEGTLVYIAHQLDFLGRKR